MRTFITLVLTLVFSLSLAQNQDCVDAIDVCSTTAFTGNSSGLGSDDFDPSGNNDGCLDGENQSAWYRINVVGGGTLDFTITPDANTDYDFALFRSSDCANLGSPIRCSYASPCDLDQSFSFLSLSWVTTGINDCDFSTGLSFSSTQNTESAFSGINNSGFTRELISEDGFVDTVQVTAGETYYLLVDNFSADFQGYTIDFSSTTADLSCTPLPLSYLSLTGKEIGINSTSIILVTSEEYNVRHHILEKKTYLTEDFVAIDTIIAENNSYNDYNFIDNNFKNSSYYRINSRDFDGQQSVSNVIYIAHSDKRNYQVTPNPASEYINTPDTDYAIVNTIGQRVHDGSKRERLDITSYPRGVYFVTTTYGSQKLIIK